MVDSNGNVFFSRLRKVNDSVFGRILDDFLIEGENIIGTYQNIRDGVVFTNKRIIVIGAQIPNGKRKNYTSFPYRNISVFSLENEGAFDVEPKLSIYVPGIGTVKFQFSHSSDFKEFYKKIFGFALS
jgi:hypothetical protein